MKKRSHKDKAIFLIILIISAIVSFSFIIKPVQAQQEGCCEVTNDGDYCLERTREECNISAGSFDENLDCDEASFCDEDRYRCCFYEDTGECSPRTIRNQCEDGGGTVFDVDICEAVPECQKGCSRIGTQCNWITERQHEILKEDLPDAEEDFIEGLDAFACDALCEEEETGCCVSEEGTYAVTVRSECQDPNVFHNGITCSSLEDSPCQTHTGSGCHDGSLYWEDSCGNREDVKDECNYEEGRYCRDNEEENTAECIDVNCADTYEDEWNVHDPKIGGLRQNAERWCIYESPTGNFLDRPGSIHYRHACLNGEEVVRPCRSFRQEICIQGSDGGAQDLEQRDIEDIPDYELSPIDPDDSPYTLEDGFSGARCEDNGIYDSNVINPSSSTVPLGFSFWESQELGGLDPFGMFSLNGLDLGPLQDYINPQQMMGDLAGPRTDLDRTESNANGDAICASANEQVTVKWLVCPTGGSECIENCWAEEEVMGLSMSNLPIPLMGSAGKWITKKAEECKSLGDCGFDYGVESDVPSGGSSFRASWEGSAPGPKPTEINPMTVNNWGSARGIFGGQKNIGNEYSRFLDLLGQILPNLLNRGGGGGGGDFDAGAAGGGAVAGAAIGSYFGLPGMVIGAIVGALAGLFGFQCEEETKTVTVTCRPWQPVSGGENCDLCKKPEKFEQLKTLEGEPLNVCTEYRCRALGTACEGIETMEGYACIDSDPGDSSSPTIYPNLEILEGQGFSIEDKGRNGFTITNLLPASTPIVLAVTTDELAQCSYTTDVNEAFNEFEEYPNTLTMGMTEDHQKIIAHPPSDDMEIVETTYYIKCRDAHGNSNDAPYAIRFNVDIETDLTPPRVIGVIGPVFIPSGETATRITALIYDANTVQCRFAKEDISYENMPEENQMLCDGHRADEISFYCYVELIDLDLGENNFYIRCMDPEGSNTESRSAYEYTVSGTEGLEIIVLADSPSGTIFRNDILLAVRTEKGAEEGVATCEYSKNGEPFIEFRNTGGTDHSQSQTRLLKGHYLYDIKCTDLVENEDTAQIEFDVDEDLEAPRLLNIYKQGGRIRIILNEESTCEASNQNFEYGTGVQMTEQGSTEHSIEIEFPVYTIKCVDAYNNLIEPPFEVIP
ncbi:MAG: hypothetical protein ABIB47_00440 [Candidatus Woesearchaeota archaeon]